MLQRWKNRVPLAAGAGLCAMLVGIAVLAAKTSDWLQLPREHALQMSLEHPKSSVLPLVSLSPAVRMVQLSAIAQLPLSQNRNRARYLLASDYLLNQQAEPALQLLEGLDRDYPILAAPIIYKRAQAYEILGDTANAQATYQELLQRYSTHPVAVEALYVLGTPPQYWQNAIAQFPSHPRTLEIARLLLQQNPNQPQLMLLLAKHAYEQPGVVAVLDQLVSQYSGQLQPQDWEAIAIAYWENQVYSKAAAAYRQAPRTALNVYRIGRSFQLSNKRTEAIAAYQQFLREFPAAPESGTALLNLAQITQNSQQRTTYLDQIVKQFPQQAGEALAQKATILDNLGNKTSATQTRQLLLDKYGDSDAAVEYRWRMALQKAANQDYQAAWQWAQPIPTSNPKNILAPRAGFWIGKWALQLEKQQEAKAAFEYVLSQFPQSYYAWRSATMLGLDVGNFNTVRQLNFEITPPQRTVLPAGSDTLKELYQLGQNTDAWALWRTEFQNYHQPTVSEQFTDGLLRTAIGQHLKGINLVSTLEDRESPQDQTEYQALRQELTYWQARYPFPFFQEITTWSQKRQLNPFLVTALIRQESRFEPKIRSVAGAVGLMQVMPSTGEWIAQKIDLKEYNKENPQDNMRLGTWYLDYTHEQYDDNSMLAIASYNAGPGNVAKWLRTLNTRDPDEFVEAIPFEETRGYVRQVFGNYWNYLRLYNPEVAQLVANSARQQTYLPQPPK
ncbi:transglycosylase SLT domain-containing protein [Gloeocapsopsis dulcis]|uniref:Tail length tape measure protein n=1 Tax=Gloeocapsopsis dulcis AAB1 = 1H9 TaxID=1433147 RepID=A0A6N8G1R9_9CHRO|nr:transglycosylase SLT domain-containing protein [Gloeocapsopsis dulcis]MUL39039.1 tail length tape measure protein [Gloeocapsopsis dulcis AAB1 = 1H9]WNN90727.1 transglycosylase SLT domain-containing protein [Gloeocapsopsis dulcis]